jgi:hypothetical protein
MNSFENFESFKNSSKFHKSQYHLGISQEAALFPTLKAFFNDDTLEPLPDGSYFDFTGSNKLIEMKSRTCHRLTYSDTAIGVQKIEYASYTDKDVYFVFKFANGLFYWKYDRKEELRYGMIPTTGIPHFFIPTSILSPMIV